MFDILSKVVSDTVNGAANTANNFVDNPVGTTIDMATKPIRDGIEVVDGLTEGELRVKAATSL